MRAKVKYSVIVPVFNEEETIEKFVEEVIPVMKKTDDTFEIIFINDGSRDHTAEILNDLAKAEKRIKVINFSRNFGQQSALFCGFENASGDAIIDIDVDLQDPPEVILEMIEKWKEGFDIVHGKRKIRKGESILKKATSTIYMKFLKSITGMEIPQHTGDFKLFDRKVIDTIKTMPEHNRFLRGLTTWVGFKQTEVEFERAERCAGETKYTLKKLISLASNGVIANSNYPLTLSLKTGLTFGVLSVATFIALIVLVCLKIEVPLVAWLFPTIVFFASGLSVFNGLSNLYIARIYDEVKNRPIYIVGSKINFDEHDEI
ncbi:MAG: glycosyltransferase family 2 protein [Clostridia bacterium]|nr:glycosyltransferase family 2 protein [Clostridia bacterium]